MNYDIKVTIDNNGKKTTQVQVLIQINDKDENWLSHVEIDHGPKQKLLFNYARLTDGDGNIIRKLKKKEFVTRNRLSYQAFYQDDLITEFDLYWNQYPYRVEYSYSMEEEEYLYLAWWTPIYIADVPTKEASLQINIPTNFSVQIRASENLIFQETEIEDRRIFSWRSAIRNSPPRQNYSPTIEKLIPVVKVVPSKFKYGISGHSDSWSSFGVWLDQLNAGTDQLSKDEKQTVQKLIDGIDNRNEIIKALYYYLQDQTKYVNVAIDVGGLKSYPASYVSENKYGDCKALTTYMKAMLNCVGIESVYTIIKAGEKHTEIDVNFPSQQFNHVILMIPSQTDTLWLENTSNALPFDYLGTFTQNRYALAINGEKSQLVKTPPLSVDDVLLERHYNFLITKKNEVQIDLNLFLRGKEFEDFRYFMSEKDIKSQNKEVSNLFSIRDFKYKDWEIIDFQRDSTFLRIHTDGSSSSTIRQIGSFQVINPLRIELPNFENPDVRELDVTINFPINRSDRSIFNLQNFGEKEIQVPEGIRIENEYGLYSANCYKKGHELIVDEKFTLYANNIPIDKYEDLFEFIESINTYKKKTAILIK